MSEDFDGLGLRNLRGFMNIATGEDIRCLCALNAKLYGLFKADARNGRLIRSEFTLYKTPDLMPHLALLDIASERAQDKAAIEPEAVSIAFIGSELERIYNMPNWKRLSDYQNRPVIEAITASINQVRTTGGILSGGTLFDTDVGPLLLQATFVPIGPEQGAIDRVMVYISRNKPKDYEAAAKRLAAREFVA